MSEHLKFDVSKLERLNDSGRLETIIPGVMWEALGRPQPRVIVDIGAGTGLFASVFARLAPDAVVYAADMEPAMIEWMRSNRPEVEAGRIVPVLSEEVPVPLETAAADLVVMINLHHELADRPASYREALRLLAPQGQLLVVDWAPVDSPSGPPQRVRATAEEATAVMLEAGFTDVTSHPGLPYAWLVTGVRP